MSTVKRFGNFELHEKIGAGGMATVYRAVQTSLDRPVVLKILHPHLSEDDSLVARFEREARAAANLRHENIVQVIDCGRAGDTSYIAMEFVDGMDLKRLMDRHGAPPVEMALLILRDVARGLEHAHQHRVIHRDIKPANLMLTPDGTVKIMDFGLARRGEDSVGMTATGAVLGTPAYMSPEQATGQRVDERSDVFSVGVVGYELLGGRRPFPGDSYASVLNAILTQEPEPLRRLNPDVPPEVEKLIGSLLEKDPARRCPSIARAREELETIVERMGLVRSKDLLRRYAADPMAVAGALRAGGPAAVLATQPPSRPAPATTDSATRPSPAGHVAADSSAGQATVVQPTGRPAMPPPAAPATPPSSARPATTPPAGPPAEVAVERPGRPPVAVAPGPALPPVAAYPGPEAAPTPVSSKPWGRLLPVLAGVAVLVVVVGVVAGLRLFGRGAAGGGEGDTAHSSGGDLQASQDGAAGSTAAKSGTGDGGPGHGGDATRTTQTADHGTAGGTTQATAPGGGGHAAKTGVGGTSGGTAQATAPGGGGHAAKTTAGGSPGGTTQATAPGGGSGTSTTGTTTPGGGTSTTGTAGTGGGPADKPPPQGSRRYRLGTRPSFAYIYLDGSETPLNPDGRFPTLTLSAGRHKFRAVNQDLVPPVDIVFDYVVDPADANNTLILNLVSREVQARFNRILPF